jgi:leucyl aminopeptidase
MVPLLDAVAFFELGTLAAVRRFAAAGRIEIAAVPDVLPVLEELRQEGVRLGLLFDPGPVAAERAGAALERAGLLPFFAPELVLHGAQDSPQLFEQATAQAGEGGVGSGRRPALLFVGENAAGRALARAAGFLVAPHPGLARTVLREREPLFYLRIRIPPATAEAADWREALRRQPLVPLHDTAEPAAGEPVRVVYAIAGASAAASLDDLGFWVDRLGAGDGPLAADLYLLRDDLRAQGDFLIPAGNSASLFGSRESAPLVLASTHEGLLVALPAGRPVESFHFRDARHGHVLKLTGSPALLEPADPARNPRLAKIVEAAGPLFGAVPARAAAGPLLSEEEREVLAAQITPTALCLDVERYAGARPVAGGARIASRHALHPDNAVAVAALTDDLERLGAGRLAVCLHFFQGGELANVEASLAARGKEGIVLVSAHLDSTAAGKTPYDPKTYPAPGADDDASGIAGVLCAARALLHLDAALDGSRREIRFLLFNDEERGLCGSRAYAGEQAALGAPIMAVFQMDMIGFTSSRQRLFELHAGCWDNPKVQLLSERLADLAAAVAGEVSPNLAPAQIFLFGTYLDPASGTSDHTSFHKCGYPACLASENPFPGPTVTGFNPDYHRPTDRRIDEFYAADIARTVAAAAWLAATR